MRRRRSRDRNRHSWPRRHVDVFNVDELTRDERAQQLSIVNHVLFPLEMHDVVLIAGRVIPQTHDGDRLKRREIKPRIVRHRYTVYVATVYCTLPVRARFQLMNRSARNPTRFACHNDVNTVVASGGFVGAESICSDASRETSIVTPPSSATKMFGGDSKMTLLPTA